MFSFYKSNEKWKTRQAAFQARYQINGWRLDRGKEGGTMALDSEQCMPYTSAAYF
jgi:hypothetical protein